MYGSASARTAALTTASGLGVREDNGGSQLDSSKLALYGAGASRTTSVGALSASARLPSVARNAAMPCRLAALVRWISGYAAVWVASSAAVRSAISASAPASALSVLVKTTW